jgi:hypothetical protein
MVQAISRGANPSTYIMGTPGQIPYPSLPVAREITRFHRRWRYVYDGMRPCARTGVIRPTQQMRSAADHERSIAEFRGIYAALQQTHVAFDVVPQESIADMAANASLKRYSVLVLPDLGELSADAAQTLDAFVNDSGRLVATGSSGLATDGSVQLECLAARRQLAATTKADLLWSTYVAPNQSSGRDPNVYTGPIAPIYGAYHFCDWKPDAEHRLAMLARASFGPPEKAYGNAQVGHPGYVLWSHGRGRSAQIPWTVGRAYRDLGLTVERDVISSIVRELLAGDESVSADLPTQVELTVHKTGPRTVVHLINMSGASRTNFGPPLPVRGGSLRLSGFAPTARAHALVSDSACEVTTDADGVSVALPELGLFEVIVIDPTDTAHNTSNTGRTTEITP